MHRAQQWIRPLTHRDAEEPLGQGQGLAHREAIRRAAASDRGGQVLVQQVPHRIHHRLVQHVVVERHLVPARDPDELHARVGEDALDGGPVAHRQPDQRQGHHRRDRHRPGPPEIVAMGPEPSGVGHRGHRDGRDCAQQGRDGARVLPEERLERHPDVVGLGEVGEEHLPEVLVALVIEEQIDAGHQEIQGGQRPERARQHGAAGAAGDQEHGAHGEQLRGESGGVQAEAAGDHRGGCAAAGWAEPGHEQRAVDAEDQHVQGEHARGVGGEPKRARRRAHRTPNSARKNPTRWPKPAPLSSAQMLRSAKNVHTPAIRRTRVRAEGAGAAAVPRRPCSRRIDT